MRINLAHFDVLIVLYTQVRDLRGHRVKEDSSRTPASASFLGVDQQDHTWKDQQRKLDLKLCAERQL